MNKDNVNREKNDIKTKGIEWKQRIRPHKYYAKSFSSITLNWIELITKIAKEYSFFCWLRNVWSFEKVDFFFAFLRVCCKLKWLIEDVYNEWWFERQLNNMFGNNYTKKNARWLICRCQQIQLIGDAVIAYMRFFNAWVLDYDGCIS